MYTFGIKVRDEGPEKWEIAFVAQQLQELFNLPFKKCVALAEARLAA